MPDTPMGANLAAGGASFRVWGGGAKAVYINGSLAGQERWTEDTDPANWLTKDSNGYWSGFVPGVRDGDTYKFFVVGNGRSGHKRDPYARELSENPGYPVSNCIVRDPGSYPWHDHGFRPPPFNDHIIYQLHVGTFQGPDREHRVSRFLDVLDRLDHLVALGVSAIELLPVVEFASPRSLGYDGVDLFSPEMDYNLDRAELDPYLARANALLARRGHAPLDLDTLAVPINQLKALIDICHIHGLAVILHLVYNHAGFQVRDQKESLYFFDLQSGTDPNDSLYFTRETHIGPVFAFWRREVRQFLIDNACFLLEEYHADGFRHDRVEVIVHQNVEHGWAFCQSLTDTVRFRKPGAFQVAEYWPVDPWVTRGRNEGGAGFDAAWHDGLRGSIRGVVAQAAGGSGNRLDLDAVARNLYAPGFPAAWKAVQHLENADEVYKDRQRRIPALADGADARSWYGRSRSRVAMGLLLTAPGVPLLFMGQELLEWRSWSDNPEFDSGTLIDWGRLDGGDKVTSDFLRFTQELAWLRRRHPALRGQWVNPFHVHNDNRVLAFHRWLEGVGRDVVVIASLSEANYYGYGLGFPQPGHWLEVFNSDVYDNWVNPVLAGNGGSVWADGPPLHGLPRSARITIPAGGLLVFARDAGD